MSFFSIVPRSKGFLDNYSNAIPLTVIQDDGIDVKPNLNINVSDLSKGYKHFYNSGSVGITFKINIIIHKDEEINGDKLIDLLDNYIRSMTPLLIHTDAIDIPNTKEDAYLIIENNSRKQHYLNYTIWELEFMTYTPLNVFKYKNDNTGVLKALNKAKKHTKTTKKASTKNSKLSKCDYKTLVYSSKKKNVKCVEYLQQILKKQKVYKGKIDGWFGKDTKNAVKQFQKNYNKKIVKVSSKKGTSSGISVIAGTLVTNTQNNPNINLPSGIKLSKATANNSSNVVKLKGINKILRCDGKVDKATWNALCKA